MFTPIRNKNEHFSILFFLEHSEEMFYYVNKIENMLAETHTQNLKQIYNKTNR